MQTIIPMPEEGALRLTTALYYGPDGQTIQARGVNPEIHIISGLKQEKRRRESDLPGFLPAQNKHYNEDVVTISNKSCPAIASRRRVINTSQNGDRTLGCAVAYFKIGSKQNFLAAFGLARSM